MGVFRSTLRPVVVGASHRTSSQALRAALALDTVGKQSFAGRLRASGIGQALILSADDRIEVLALHGVPSDAESIIMTALAARVGAPVENLAGHLYRLNDGPAIRHFLAVVGSLDGVVVGEPRILEEVRASHQNSREAGLCAADLDSLMAAGYRVAGRIRAETAVGERPVSIADVAVELARDLHGDLAKCAVFVLGDGDTGIAIGDALVGAGAKPLNGADTLSIKDSDILVSAVGDRAPSIDATQVREALRQRRQKPIFLIDAGIPGDIDTGVNRLEGAYLYDLNDLERIAMQGRTAREGAARRAWAIIDAEVATFAKGALKTGQVLPLLDAIPQTGA